MDRDDHVHGFVEKVMWECLQSFPARYAERTISCPSLPELVEIARESIDDGLAIHAVTCRHCGTTLRAALAALGQDGSDWESAVAAVNAYTEAGSEPRQSLDIERQARGGARAFAAARAELATRPLSSSVRKNLIFLAIGLGQLLGNDNDVSDMLTQLSWRLRVSDSTHGDETDTVFASAISELVTGWASERALKDTVDDLRVARDLYLTIGNRPEAARCASLAAAHLDRERLYAQARVEFAHAALHPTDDKVRSEAIAGFNRTNVRLEAKATASRRLDRQRTR